MTTYAYIVEELIMTGADEPVRTILGIFKNKRTAEDKAWKKFKAGIITNAKPREHYEQRLGWFLSDDVVNIQILRAPYHT